ncbi:MAG: 1-phosphofructokinase [Anaerolineae bacterium]
MIVTVTLNPSLDRTVHFPGVAWGAVNRASRSALDLSGKGVNVSIALRQLGHESVIVGLAAGAFGRVLVEGLQAQGYRCEFVETAGETRSNVTVIEDGTGRSMKLNEAGPPAPPEALAALEARLAGLLSPGDIVALAGSLPPGAPVDTYARLVDVAHGCGALVALDSSGPALAAGCRAAPDLIKPNEHEAAELVGHPLETDLSETLNALRALGPGRVLLSLGATGAAYADGTGCWRATPPPITEVNNVGAGDAALAGAIAAWSEGAPPEEILRLAVATGTATACLDGTAFPPRAAVKDVYCRVTVTREGGE